MNPTATPRAFTNDGNIISSAETKDVEQIGLGSLLFKHMSANKDSTAQIDTVTGQLDTYGSMLQRSIRTAIAMRAKGINFNNIVTVCSSNHLNTCIPLIVSYFLGAKAANTDPNLSLLDTVHLLKQVRPSMNFVSADAVTLIENVVQELGLQVQIVVFGESSKHSQFSEFLVESPEESNFAPVEVADVKERRKEILEHSPPIVMLMYSSSYWITSLMRLMTNTINKIVRLLSPAFDPVNLWQIIEKYQANLLILTPNQISTMLNYGPGDANVSSVKVVITTGAPFSVKQIESTKKAFLFAVVTSGFGVTEAGGPAIIFNIAYEEDIKLLTTRPHSCGRPVAGFYYRILKPTNLSALTKDILKFQSYQIAPAALEAVLLTHPAVDSVVVIGIPHPSDGDHPIAVVQLKKSIASSVRAKDIEKYVEERVSEMQRLRGSVKIVHKLSLTAPGKLQKRHVKELVLGKKL